MNRSVHRLRPLAAVALATWLAGCASLSPDGGFGAVAQTTKSRTWADTALLRNEQDQKALADQLHAMLAQPLTMQNAVQIALLNNRGLQASYWQLGIAEADLVQAGRLQNPGFTFKRTHGGGEVGIERTLTVNLIQLITMPLASRVEAQRHRQVQLQLAGEALKVANDTRRAWVEAVAALQSVDYARQVSDAADAGAELAGRMQQAGNWSKLDAAREQAFHAEAIASLSHARKAALASREKLARLLGVSGPDAAFQLPERLPELPTAARSLPDVEQTALRERLDIQSATEDTRYTAANLGLNRATRFINVLDLGFVKESASGTPGARGYELTLEIPLFDWGTARVARAEAVYMQSVNRLAETVANARSEARESYQDYQGSYELAKHYRDVVIPLRQQVSQETLLRYNGMLLSVFELLADAREQAGAVNNYIGALRDFWIADANLDAALGGQPAPTTAAGATP
jgi:outer membrane protein TolC